jgi:hypothetical protein
MKTSMLAWLLVAAVACLAAPLQAQHVSAHVIVRGGPVSGRVTVDDGYSSYRRPVRHVVVQRYVPRVVRVERVRHHHVRHWRLNGYRQVVVYYVDGRYFDRIGRDYPGAYGVVVYERNGRFYRDD